MLPSVAGADDAALRLGIFRSMNQLVSWNRRRFPLGHGPFANDTFCKTTGDLATLRKRHGIQCATMGTKEGTSRRDSPCQRHRTPPLVQSNCTPGKEYVPEPNRTQLAHAAERHRRAGAGAWGSSVEPSVPRFGLGDGIIPQGLEVGADGIVVEGLPNALHGEKSFGLAVPGRCFADLSCEITKLLLNFTNYTGCG